MSSVLKSITRNFLHQKSFSLINLLGFTAGLLCCAFIMLYIRDETNYDRHFPSAQKVFRLTTRMHGSINAQTAMTSPPIAEAIRSAFPEVQQTTRLLKLPAVDQHLVRIMDDGTARASYFESGGFLADNTFFEVLGYQLLSGDPMHALEDPYSIVISDVLATKYFRNEEPIGRSLHLSNAWGDYPCTITGVFKHTTRSHIPAHFFISMHSGEAGDWVQRTHHDWVGNNHYSSYVLLRTGTDPDVFATKITGIAHERAGEQLSQKGITKEIGLEGISAIHLNPPMDSDLSPRGNRRYLTTLGIIGIFVLLIGCINYMNLSTARFISRRREVGVLKVLGASRQNLIQRFIGESVFMALIAYSMTAALLMALLPYYENFAKKIVEMQSLAPVLVILLGVSVATGLCAGSYPALNLSSLRPIEAFRSSMAPVRGLFGGINLRKALVTTQFAISVCLIFGVAVIWQQMHFLKHTELGFDQRQKVVVPLKTVETELKYPEIKSEISRLAGVHSVSACTSYPGRASFIDVNLYQKEKSIDESVQINVNFTDAGFAELMEFELIAGRYPSTQFASDTSGHGAWTVNEATVRALGLTPEEILNAELVTEWRTIIEDFNVVGVVRDYHFESLHENIRPQAFRITDVHDTGFGFLLADIETMRMSGTLSEIKDAWQSVLPDVPPDIRFLDEAFQANYAAEERTFRLMTFFAGLAILISCLGLFGLAAHAVERRTREVAIRKVVGASVRRLVILLSKEFLSPVLIALLVATPLAYYLMLQWLDNFAYRTDIRWWLFGFVGIVVVVIALAAVGMQSVRAALRDPVESLRNE